MGGLKSLKGRRVVLVGSDMCLMVFKCCKWLLVVVNFWNGLKVAIISCFFHVPNGI